MKKTLILILFFIQQTVFASIPLERAIKNGIRINWNQKNRILEEKKQKLNKENAEMKRLFTINFGAVYLYKSDQMEITLPDMNPAPGIIIPGEKILAGAKHNFDLNISLVQPIFTGNILSNSAKIEQIKLNIEEDKTLLNKIEISHAIKSSYFNYILLINKRKSLNTLIKQLNLHYKRINDFYKEDLIKKIDLLETEAKIKEQRINLEDMDKFIRREMINFKNLTNMNIEEINENFTEKIKSRKESFSFLKNNHPFIKSLDKRIKIFSARKKILKGEYMPHINGFAELHYGKPGIDFFENEWSLYFQGGLNIKLLAFNWNKKSRDDVIIKHSIEKIRNQREDFISNGKKYLDQLFETKKSTENKLKILEEIIQLSEEDIELKAKLFEEQQISNVDYLTSLTAKERYVSKKNETSAELELIKMNINKITGIFQEEE